MYQKLPCAQPIEKVALFNVGGSSLDAGDSILAELASGAIVASSPPSMFRIMVSMSKAGKFKAQLTQDSTTKDLTFNNDTNLAADSVYIFEMLVNEDDSIDFEQDQTDQTINVLIVQEILMGTQ